MQKHSYLFESADWLARGNYYDEEGRRSDLTGLSQICRSDGAWTLGGFMEVAGKRFTNDYELRADDELSLSWESFNPALGVLRGSFTVVDRAIISRYASENGEFYGAETLIMIDRSTYETYGALFEKNRRMSSWSARLTKKI